MNMLYFIKNGNFNEKGFPKLKKVKRKLTTKCKLKESALVYKKKLIKTSKKQKKKKINHVNQRQENKNENEQRFLT